MELLTQLNWFAILLATVVSFVLGYLWYGPLFGKAWLDELGKSPEELGSGASPFVISAVLMLIASSVMAVLVACIGIETWFEGATLGFAIGIGFIATSYFSDAQFGGKSTKLTLIESGYRVVYTLLIGIILGAWQ